MDSRSAAFVALVVGCAFGQPAPAEACSPLCPTADVWPRDGVEVPASARTLRFTQCGCDARTTLTWTGPDGRPVAFQPSGASDVVAGADLALGVHTLTFDQSQCGHPAGTGVATRAFKAVATPAAPSSFGTVSVLERGVERRDVSTATGSCTRPTEAAVAEVRWNLDPAIAAWAAVSDLEAVVDGSVAAARRAPLANPSSLELHGECSTSDAGERSGLPLGAHSLVLRATTLAGASVTSAPVPFRLDCGAAGSTPGDEAAPAAEAGRTPSGCGTSGGSGLLHLTTIGALPLALARRRSRQRA